MNTIETEYKQFYNSYQHILSSGDYDYLCLHLNVSRGNWAFRLYRETDPSSCEESFCHYLLERKMLRYAETVLDSGADTPNIFGPQGTMVRYDYALSRRTPENIQALLAEIDSVFQIGDESKRLRTRLSVSDHNMGNIDSGSRGQIGADPETGSTESWLYHLGLAYKGSELDTVKYYFTSHDPAVLDMLSGKISMQFDSLLEHAAALVKKDGAQFWMAGLDTGRDTCKCKIYLKHFRSFSSLAGTLREYYEENIQRLFQEILDWSQAHPELWFAGIALGLDLAGDSTVNLYFTSSD